MTGPLRRTLAEESWDALFDFLDPSRSAKTGADRNAAAEAKYLELTRKLSLFFASRSCAEADDLAAETILRVATKAAEVKTTSGQDPLAYFFGVARNVHFEWLRDTRRETKKRELAVRDLPLVALPDVRAWRNDEAVHRCLDQCMETLNRTARRLLLSYYREDKSAKIEHHRQLASEFGKSVNALRVEVHRIRKLLRRCVVGCVHPELAGAVR